MLTCLDPLGQTTQTTPVRSVGASSHDLCVRGGGGRFLRRRVVRRLLYSFRRTEFTEVSILSGPFDQFDCVGESEEGLLT